ncbi:hypothetical protein [Desulfosporosinus sp. FKA]|uniref:hypothetical protein n=1 Tax=Desulfosporosinus sp. FKA TaxID=1969834 RepID=UPI000B4A0816|nr:hypothetical protein [Desulfosporosinus sp. FKA]
MTPLFQCQKCLKAFVPKEDLYSKVYAEQSLCMMCRKAGGQDKFTPEENMSLFAEEQLAK